MDFSGLDNEQLLLLLKAAMAEAAERGLAMQRAASEAVMDAQELARIKAEATEKAQVRAAELERQRIVEQAQRQAEASINQQRVQTEAEKIAAGWSKRKAIAVALQRWGMTEDWQINLWSRGADARVYVEGGGSATAYGWKMCLYITGNAYNPPGALDIDKRDLAAISTEALKTKDGQQQFKGFLLAINERWNGLKLSNGDVKAFDGDPNPKHLAAYLTALGVGNV